MRFELRHLTPEHEARFKRDMQDAFQKSAIERFGEMREPVLPLSDIDRSLSADGAAAYEAVVDGAAVGGAVVVTDDVSGCGHLDFLYVKTGVQNKGVGLTIWQAIERAYPGVKVWETVTPYFDRRNIHFYVNKCGFRVIEFFNKHHPDPNDTDELPDIEYFDGMFRFEKVMD